MGVSWVYPNSWLVYIGKAIYKWMMTRDTPYDLGNLQISPTRLISTAVKKLKTPDAILSEVPWCGE